MNNLTVFSNPDFGSIRTVTINNKPYFCACDVARALGYARPNDAVRSHCRATVKHSTPISRKMQEINFIPEGDVYRLIVRSKLPSAEKFESWVFDTVLPSIRQNGGYIMNQENLSDSELLAKAVLVAQKTIANKDKIIEQQKAKIEQDKPKALFADAVAASHTSILIGELAKLLKQNGIETGLRICQRRGQWNLDYLRSRKVLTLTEQVQISRLRLRKSQVKDNSISLTSS